MHLHMAEALMSITTLKTMGAEQDALDADNENLTALDLQLSPAHVAALDNLSEPTLNFPSQIVRTFSLNASHAGATVNGVPSTVMFPSLLNNEKERY
jgi:hypothetical protein